VVVTVAIAMERRTGRSRWSLIGTTVLLISIAVLPLQPCSAVELSSGTQARRSGGLDDGALRRLLPSLQLSRIDELAGGSQAREIFPSGFGTSVSPIGSPNPALSVAFGWSETGVLQTQGLEPAAYGLLTGLGSTGAGVFGLDDDSSALITGGADPSGIRAVCSDNQTAMRLQAGGTFRPAQVRTAAPVQLPPGVFGGRSLDINNSLGDPIDGPSGDRANLPPRGPTGAWCLPGPVPFSQSSPLASRAFWTPFALAFVGVVVFLLSRGAKIPA
jgi:hypothetical protein